MIPIFGTSCQQDSQSLAGSNKKASEKKHESDSENALKSNSEKERYADEETRIREEPSDIPINVSGSYLACSLDSESDREQIDVSCGLRSKQDKPILKFPLIWEVEVAEQDIEYDTTESESQLLISFYGDSSPEFKTNILATKISVKAKDTNSNIRIKRNLSSVLPEEQREQLAKDNTESEAQTSVCLGTEYQGNCYYLSNEGDSCENTCRARGLGYSDFATQLVNQEKTCGEILTFFSTNLEDNLLVRDSIYVDAGCTLMEDRGTYSSFPPTSQSRFGPDLLGNRVCGCE